MFPGVWRKKVRETLDEILNGSALERLAGIKYGTHVNVDELSDEEVDHLWQKFCELP